MSSTKRYSAVYVVGTSRDVELVLVTQRYGLRPGEGDGNRPALPPFVCCDETLHRGVRRVGRQLTPLIVTIRRDSNSPRRSCAPSADQLVRRDSVMSTPLRLTVTLYLELAIVDRLPVDRRAHFANPVEELSRGTEA